MLAMYHFLSDSEKKIVYIPSRVGVKGLFNFYFVGQRQESLGTCGIDNKKSQLYLNSWRAARFKKHAATITPLFKKTCVTYRWYANTFHNEDIF